MHLKSSDTRELSILKLFTFFSYGSVAVLFVYFPVYFSQQGLSKLEVGMIMAGGPFISIIANPFWGYVSDRYQNIRRTIVLLLLGSLIVVQAVLRIDMYALLFAGMLMFFFFQSPLASQGNSLILNTIDGTGYKFGSFRLWGSLGYAVIAVAAGPVFRAIGMDELWIIYSVMLMIALLFTVGMPKGDAAVKSVFSNQGYRAVFTNRLFLIFVLLGVLVSIPNSVNSTFVSIYIQELGGSEVYVGWAAFLSAAFEVPVFLLLDRFIRRETRFMIICLAVISVLFSLRWGLMAFASEPEHILMIQLLHCVTFGGYYYLGTTLTAHLIPAEYRASGQAAFALTWGGVSGIMAGFMGGWLYETFGAAAMYRVNVLVSLCGVAGFMLMIKLVRDQHRESARGQEEKSTSA